MLAIAASICSSLLLALIYSLNVGVGGAAATSAIILPSPSPVFPTLSYFLAHSSIKRYSRKGQLWIIVHLIINILKSSYMPGHCALHTSPSLFLHSCLSLLSPSTYSLLTSCSLPLCAHTFCSCLIEPVIYFPPLSPLTRPLLSLQLSSAKRAPVHSCLHP